ncbi:MULTISPECIES: nitronate monooxygenase family protein [unclassified Polynucleobacter]|uniref:NAD(P)H-dependent flavin oxidoreductase n=1 Tax=unclassified Polynucleobacter TaxID=2640945 RepID=UPI001F27CAED|nr:MULTISPECIES: nitronate monooxygenase family protein [unclassified Polynucleobacter]MCE7527521.1 nitronate monooxygenase family protein [Polynucleobacter sp. IMCC 30228]MCE7530469.1 nitronate monooxygenase family protein [Polynucleobacter sp. IMCC 29146]
MNPLIPQSSDHLLASSGLKSLTIKGKTILPIVQGGMGVGVSAHRLAGAVAKLGGMGTISSIDLRRLHPDLMDLTQHLLPSAISKKAINQANLEALKREIKMAQEGSSSFGLIAVNVMRAVNEYEAYVACALESGVDAIVVGAGLPLDLPDLAAGYPATALIPILSEARGVQILVKKWEKKGRLPDAIVIENPKLAGGHLGASSVADINNPKFDFEHVIPQVINFFKTMGIEGQIPLIAAGGISNLQDIQKLQSMGVSGVQLGTAFAVTIEGDADQAFKKVLAGSKPEELVEFLSVAGLPARAVMTPWLKNYMKAEAKLKNKARKKPRCTMIFDCLHDCGLRDGNAAWGQFCIDKVLGSALTGDTQKGLFFRGAGILPFGDQIRSVADLFNWLLLEVMPKIDNYATN